MRLIDIEPILLLRRKLPLLVMLDEILSAPTIDIVTCAECKWEWTQKCPPHRMGLIHDADDFCSYGCRKESE